MTRAYAHLIAFLSTLPTRVEGDKDRGATAVEYGLLVGLIAIGLIAGMTLLKDELAALFTLAGASLPGAPA